MNHLQKRWKTIKPECQISLKLIYVSFHFRKKTRFSALNFPRIWTNSGSKRMNNSDQKNQWSTWFMPSPRKLSKTCEHNKKKTETTYIGTPKIQTKTTNQKVHISNLFQTHIKWTKKKEIPEKYGEERFFSSSWIPSLIHSYPLNKKISLKKSVPRRPT